MEMLFKGISYLELWQAFVQWRITICAFSGFHEKQLCVFFLFFFLIWVSGSGGYVIKKVSYLELFQPFSVKLNYLCNFERGHHGEHSCEVI